ncbi:MULTISPECIES: glycosyltransferase [Winogradskyella]|uniref:glycosyltransferase n=1 Tax=Winogradskyella TaxID=286104 RepID=UPI0015C76EFC|nr:MULTISPECIES: glycosyltransferase [Winogradskyella]QXP80600.1 glycosyltransferase [Winogradskyella sp. HaHa_3_26]
MNKIKVAHILNSVGGVDVYLRLILENIESSNFHSIVIHSKEDTKKPYLDNKKRLIKDYKLPIQREINVIKDLLSIYQTIKILKKEKPNVIHAHSAKGGVVGKAVGFILKTPVLYTPHAYSYLSAETKFKKKLYLLVEKYFRRTNNKVLATSISESNRAILDVGYKKENALLFNNSINPISEIKPLSINKNWPDNYICSVGRPSFQKNIELMVEVLAETKKTIKDIHLVLMGVGFYSPNLNSVKDKIIKLGLENNITLLEWTTRADIFNIIKASQLYISTARYEGLPYSIIESLALGKAIVATDADGNRDLVEDNYNGYLIFNEDKYKFSEGIIELINNNEKNNKFSQNSLALFNSKFDITKNICKLEKIYCENLKK